MDAYIAAASPDARAALSRIRQIAREAAPDAEETLSYRIPAFRGHGILIYFAAFKNHIGLYPPVAADGDLDAALAPYRGPKRNLRFPLDQEIPYELIERIVRLRVEQDDAKAASRKGGRPPARDGRPL
jgi:uncharacterized protein YdhG (YjbR/CyaY superfamily)